MLSSKDLIGILYDFVWDIMFYFFSIYFVCTCFFVDKYLRDIVYLEKLIYMRDDTSSIDIFFICCVLFGYAKQYHSLKTMLMFNAHPCISLIICFVMPLTYLFDASVKLNFLFMISCNCLCFKWYWGSKDSMLCTLYSNANSNLCTYLGELPHFI